MYYYYLASTCNILSIPFPLSSVSALLYELMHSPIIDFKYFMFYGENDGDYFACAICNFR